MYDARVCIHAGNRVKSLSTVFKVVEGKFVIRVCPVSVKARSSFLFLLTIGPVPQTVVKGELR